ncbi:hypothetical protein [Pediococcus parvulus]|uniref:hypothetical protein n=1 Tax=Pediococcus parvulus TaxID=54062 RepID=UPI0021A2EE8F|nr:hypothetical protein [Pediococcus parvulus]MCT3031216.1 hypothetical protein [Pediococcus parvulus]
MANNTVLDYLNSGKREIVGKNVGNCFSEYEKWAEKNHVRCQSFFLFQETMWYELGLTIQGSDDPYFAKGDEKSYRDSWKVARALPSHNYMWDDSY